MSDSASDILCVPAEILLRETKKVFQGYGLPPDAAACVAEALIEADLRGIHSHGLTRVPIYTERLVRGLFNPRPDIRVARNGSAVAAVDGDNGMGPVVGRRAVAAAVEVALEAGCAAVGVCNSNHFGIAALYAERLVARGFIAVVCSNAPPTMAPYGGRSALFGTNPLAFGVPTRGDSPILADMATSTVARGKIILAQQRGEEIPFGWALDPDGRPTRDPEAALQGVVLPFGEAKGSAIALLIDILAAVMTGAGFGTDLPDFYNDLDRPANLGHFLLAIDPARFGERDRFLDRLGRYLTMIGDCPPAEGFARVQLPGEIEAQKRRTHLSSGVPLSQDILVGLRQAARRVHVALEL